MPLMKCEMQGRRRIFARALSLAAVVFAAALRAEPLPREPENLSVRNEVETALEKALAWLEAQQRPDGSWGSGDSDEQTIAPAKALLMPVLFHRAEESMLLPERPDALARALAYLRRRLSREGGVAERNASTLEIALRLQLLVLASEMGPAEDRSALAHACGILDQRQVRSRGAGSRDGGFRAGPGAEVDLIATCEAVQSLVMFRGTPPAEAKPAAKEADLAAAEAFILRHQYPQRSSSGAQEKELKGRGGFAPVPPELAPSTAKRNELAAPTRAATAHALLALIQFRGRASSPAVAEGFDWLQRHGALRVEPGEGRLLNPEYLSTLAMLLSLARQSEWRSSAEASFAWSRELALLLINTQRSDGSWPSAAAPEFAAGDQIVATAHAVIALEWVYTQL